MATGRFSLFHAAFVVFSFIAAPSFSFADDSRRSLTSEERSERLERLRERAEMRSYGIGFEHRQIENGSSASSYREERANSLLQAEECVRRSETPKSLRECELAEQQRRERILSKLREHREASRHSEARPDSAESFAPSPRPRDFSDRRGPRERRAP